MKVAATDMRYFTRSKFSRIQLTRKILVRYDRIPLFRLNELGEKLQATIILGKFVNKSYANSHWLIVFGKCFPLVKIKARSHDVFFS